MAAVGSQRDNAGAEKPPWEREAGQEVYFNIESMAARSKALRNSGWTVKYVTSANDANGDSQLRSNSNWNWQEFLDYMGIEEPTYGVGNNTRFAKGAVLMQVYGYHCAVEAEHGAGSRADEAHFSAQGDAIYDRGKPPGEFVLGGSQRRRINGEEVNVPAPFGLVFIPPVE